MFTVSTIGSCRIATPSRLSRNRYGFKLNSARNYGFCHTSAEAVQQLQFMRGDFTPHENIWRLIARGQDRDQMLSQTHAPSDLYVVELASAKRLMHGDTCVQMNYLGNEFKDFFADKDRMREFWFLAKQDDDAAITAFLDDRWSETLDQKADSAILRDIRMTMTTEQGMRDDIRFIIDNTPNVMFVTHVNAVKLDGEPIASRSDFIDMSTRAVLAEGGVVYNPTARMHEMGQRLAIEDYSDSLAHFTEEFCHVFFWDWYELGIKPALDAKVLAGGEDAVTKILVPHIKTMIDAGLTTGLSERLAALTDAMGPLPDLVLLQSELDELGDTPQKALARLNSLFQSDSSNTVVGEQLVQTAMRNSDYDMVHATLQTMQAQGQSVDAKLIFDFAGLVRSKGQMEPAAQFMILGQKTAGATLTAAQAAAYCDVVGTVAPDAIAKLSPTDQDRLMDMAVGQTRVQLALAVRPDKVIDLCKFDIPLLAGDQVYDLLTTLSAKPQMNLAVDILALWRQGNTGGRLMHLGLRDLVDGWFNAIKDDLRKDRVPALATLLKGNPLHGPTRQLLRTDRNDILSDMRAAYVAKDMDALQALAADNAALPDPLPEFEVLQARLAYSQEDYDQTVALTQIALESSPDNIMMWLLQMRAAYKISEILTMDTAARKVRALARDDTERLGEEAQTRLARMPVTALRAAREEQDMFVAYRLYDLVATDPEYTELAESRQVKLAAKIVKDVRALEVEDPEDQFETLAHTALVILSENEKLLQSVGRYYVRQKNFEDALPFWEKIVRIDPTNDGYAYQLERCQDRIKPIAKAS